MMKEIKLVKNNMAKAVDQVAAVVAGGGVVVLPTDTIYGLHGRADDEQVIRRILRIKERSEAAGFVHLMGSYCMVHDYAFVSARQDKYLRTVWPATTRELRDFDRPVKLRPTTVILRSRGNLPAIGRGGSAGLALRLPQHELLLRVIKKLGVPLVSTSLNLSGQAEIPLDRLAADLKVWPDLVVNAGKLGKKRASRLLDIRNIDKIEIIRK